MSSAGPYLVVFSIDDPEDSRNWSNSKKRLVVAQICILTFAAVFGSSFYTAASLQLMARYGASDVVVNLGLSGYVLGFSFGPVVSQGPLSEMYGRRLPYLLSWPLFVAACAPSAYINNLAVIIPSRFLAGYCAACALNNAASVFAGPCIALSVGFFIAANTGPELWVLRVYLYCVAALLPVAFLLPETHGPTILAARSKRLRRLGNPNARAAHELREETTRQFLQMHLCRPFAMFFQEPDLQAAATWTSLAYGITYLFFEVFPFKFYQHYNFQLQYAGLPFLAMVIGLILAIILNEALVQLFVRMPFPSFLLPEGQYPDVPEARLKLSLLAWQVS
ncbi:hypothetical protein M0805_005846 [Coniferiporia weirii]|nr:hypothetical protein M0805_005846 [Coniferiporia weirii]